MPLTIPNSSGATATASESKNLLVNSGFWFNDTGYVSNTALLNTEYGHDNYKAGSGGCTYTFTQSGNLPIQINITAGSLVTAIEDFNYADYSEDVTVSWGGTAQARAVNGLTTNLLEESYAVSPITVTKTANIGLSIEFGIGTVGKIVAVRGSSTVGWGEYDIGQEKLRSQRYNQLKSVSQGIQISDTSIGYTLNSYSLVSMRINPAYIQVEAGTESNVQVAILTVTGVNAFRFQIKKYTAFTHGYVLERKYLFTARLL